ncbi:hypothetical protein EYC80_006290 [Monilinia laxa]|uniref:Uncharacterized protein n=1 Tax=Monilinia laxa TaxID=61186 RepID=A0A5N6KGS0_MONLA|nr:hypothetical protein EYC80_006290 [Monilinia laxa]
MAQNPRLRNERLEQEAGPNRQTFQIRKEGFEGFRLANRLDEYPYLSIHTYRSHSISILILTCILIPKSSIPKTPASQPASHNLLTSNVLPTYTTYSITATEPQLHKPHQTLCNPVPQNEYI